MEWQLEVGSPVVAPDGENLGVVSQIESGWFVVQRGHVMPRTIDVTFGEIAEIDDGVVLLKSNPCIFSESDATGDEQAEKRVTGSEAGYDFGGEDKPPVSLLDDDRRASPLEAGIDFGGKRKAG